MKQQEIVYLILCRTKGYFSAEFCQTYIQTKLENLFFVLHYYHYKGLQMPGLVLTFIGLICWTPKDEMMDQ